MVTGDFQVGPSVVWRRLYSAGMPDVPIQRLLAGSADGAPVLVLGTGRWTVTEMLVAGGAAADIVVGDWPSVQLERRYPLVVIEPIGDIDTAAVVHCAAQHLLPGGRIALVGGSDDGWLERFDLAAVTEAALDGERIVVAERPDRRTIHDIVFEARSRLTRTTADELAVRLTGANAPTVVDTRTSVDRQRFGAIAGSIHVPRTLLEWHLDPANGYRHEAVVSFDQPLVVICNGGYSSSLAAVSLLDLGFGDVSDLVGGMRAWIHDGYPVVVPDHSHLDI